MSWCSYDNPATMAREMWVDGKMKSFMTAALIETRGSTLPHFVPNTYRGDIGALDAAKEQDKK